MARFTKRPSGLFMPSPIVSTASTTLRTGNNAPGFARDAKSELFLLGVANFVGTDTFYEKGKVRDDRFVALVHRVAAEDPGWLSRYLIWLRREANMRTAAVIGAVEFCRAYKVPAATDAFTKTSAQAVGFPRHTMREVLQRADEPAEAIGYHLQTYGRSIPKSMKRGIADAAQRLYTEYNTLKYDTASHSIRFGDVLELCHVKPSPGVRRSIAEIAAELEMNPAAVKHKLRHTGERIFAESGGDLGIKRQVAEIDKFVDEPFVRIPRGSWRLRSAATVLGIAPAELTARLTQWTPSPQSHLFKHLIDRRHGRDGMPDGLPMIFNNSEMRRVAASNPQVLLASESLRAAGMTWEDALSLAGNKVPKKDLWEAMIPSMGYMALLRNLRNFDEAGVSDAVAQQVIVKLTDPVQVARSRQLPMRFLSAFRHAPSLRWGYPLEQALQLCLRNVPEFKGNTLILIDTSGSMAESFSKDGSLQRWDAAAVFGLALAQRCEQVNVVSFSSHSQEFHLTSGASLLTELQSFKRTHFSGGGTATTLAMMQHYRNHDRVVVLTDEQADSHYGNQGVFAMVPANRMTITFNLAGYQAGHAESGSAYRVTIGGLSDQAFKLLPILEQRAAGQWPF